MGVMLESHLEEGRQDLKAGEPLRYGVSITDANSITTSLLDPSHIPQTSNYNLYSYTFVGSGTDTLTFAMDNVPGYYDLDDVSANTPTPEPSSLLLLGTGLLGAVAASRRRY